MASFQPVNQRTPYANPVQKIETETDAMRMFSKQQTPPNKMIA